MKKQILIVDSDDRQINRILRVLQKAVKKWGGEAEVYKANSVSEADRLLEMADIDLLITDVVFKGFHFGEYPGIEWVAKIRSVEKYALLPIVFVASVPEPREYAYKQLNCLGFFTRAFVPEDLFSVLDRAMSYTTYRDEENKLLLRENGIYYPLHVKEIIYAETIERILYIHRINGEILQFTRKPLADLWKESHSDCLLQCNKSTLINRKFMELINEAEEYVMLTGEERKFPIGKKYMSALKASQQLKEEVYILLK